jgi:hypothetical protein
VLQNQTYRHIGDWQNRIKYLQIRIASLQRLGLATHYAEAELAQATESLVHLQHHRGIFEFTMRSYDRSLMLRL